MKSPLMITCALVGAELDRKAQAYLPLTPDEISQSGIETVRAGASMLHLHVRDQKGNPTCDVNVFKEVIKKIRKEFSLSPQPMASPPWRASPSRGEGDRGPVIQVSTGAAIGDSEEDRLGVLEAGAEMASLSTGSINFGKDVFLNPIPFIEKLAQKMLEKNIKPEIEVFDVSMLEMGLKLVEKGWVKSPPHFQFVLGVPGALTATERNLKFLVEGLPPEATWSVAAIGRHQFPMMELAIQWGGHARVGFEDNIYLEKGVLAKTNAELVTKVIKLAEKYQRPLATIEEARKILKI